MANINLSQSSLERKNNDINSIFDQGVMIPLGILLLVGGTLLGLKIYNGSLEKKALMLDERIVAQKTELTSGSLDRVADFEERLDAINAKMVIKDVSPQEALTLVEKQMVGGVSLDAYQYDIQSRSISLKIVSNDFKNIAQQGVNFKSEKAFHSVTVSDAAKGDGGTVTANILIAL